MDLNADTASSQNAGAGWVKAISSGSRRKRVRLLMVLAVYWIIRGIASGFLFVVFCIWLIAFDKTDAAGNEKSPYDADGE